MKYAKKCAALLLAGLMATAALTACSDSEKQQSSGQDVAMEDLEYGATMRLEKTKYAVPMQYDYRFLNDDVVTAIANYYASIEQQDTALFLTTQLPLYHDYELNEVYQKEFTDASLLETSHKTVADTLGKDYKYSLIDIQGFEKNRVVTTSADILTLLDSLSEDAGEGKISERTKDIYQLTVSVYLAEAGTDTVGETADVISDTTLFALELDGKWYVIIY